jgi:hypothetical protein
MTTRQVLGMLALVAAGGVLGATLVWLLSARPRHENGYLHGAGEYRLRARFNARMVWDRNGVPWQQGEPPDPRHECVAQTCVIDKNSMHTDRCACGAQRVGVFGAWLGRNDRWNSIGRATGSAS